jgi:hypothetical protein
MNAKQNQVPQNTEKLKEIPKWTRKYAQNRMLTALVIIAIICLIGMVISVPVALVVTAFVKGNMILAGVGIALLVAVLLFYIIFLSKFGGKNRGLIDRKIDRWIYGKEGTASMSLPKTTKKMKWLDIVAALVFAVCIIGTMHLYMDDYISVKYLLPVAALFNVPFLVFQYFLQRPRFGPLVLICPILYTIHAILIVAGVPIFFTGSLGMLNMLLPAFGYAFLAYVIGHLYSRYALKKLKGLTHLVHQDSSGEREAANGD